MASRYCIKLTLKYTKAENLVGYTLGLSSWVGVIVWIWSVHQRTHVLKAWSLACGTKVVELPEVEPGGRF